MKPWMKRMTSALAISMMTCALFTGCLGGSEAPGSSSGSDAGKKVEEPIKMEAMATLKLGEKDIPVYEFKGEEPLPLEMSMMTVTPEAIYLIEHTHGKDDKVLGKYPYKGDQLTAREDLGEATSNVLTTDGKNVYFFLKGGHLGIYDGQELTKVPLSDNREGSTQVVYGSDQAYFSRSGALKTAGYTRAKIGKDGYTDPVLLLSQKEYVHKMKDERDEVSPKLIFADEMGFYLRWTARHGSKNGQGWTSPIYLYDKDGKEVRQLNPDAGIPDGTEKWAGKKLLVCTTKDYFCFLTTGAIRVFDKNTSAYVGDIKWAIDKRPVLADLGHFAVDGDNHIYFGIWDGKDKQQHIYRMDL